MRCPLTLKWMWQKANLFSFREHLFGSKGARRFWNLGKVWQGLRQGDEALHRGPRRVEWVDEGPGCSRGSRDRGDIHPLNSACPRSYHTGRSLSYLSHTVTPALVWLGRPHDERGTIGLSRG